MTVKLSSHQVALGITASILATCGTQGAESIANANPPPTAGALAKTTDTSASGSWQKPAWLTDVSIGVKESYDDNVLEVSGNGLKPQSTWITSVSPKIGFNFAPLLGNQATLQTLSLTYAPDFFIYHDASAESYDAHRVNGTIRAKSDNVTFAFDNAFLYNDGSTTSPLYALNQLSGSLANQNDKFRNFFGQGTVRERRHQIQDRATTSLQYKWKNIFVRPTAALLYYNLDTDWHNTSAAPYKGYQNWPNRNDVNGGLDLGYYLTPKLAMTLGYRYGSQYQQRLPLTIDADNHFSSSDYQRVLLGLEGNPWKWLNVKMAGGPDFRNYNSFAPVNDFHPVKYYGEAVMTATVTANQTLTFNYKQWQWVSATGKVPYFDSLFALTYHWNATKQLGVDLGGRIQEADFTSGNETTGSASSRRDDRQYTLSAGVSYAFTPHFSANLSYAYDLGENILNLPANLEPEYRNFNRNLVSVGLGYKF
jgi:opacity protein-like surface antigen